MRTIGFNFTKNDFRYSVLEGDIKNPGFISKGKTDYPQSMETPELMDRIETQLNEIIVKHKPNKVGYKIFLPFKGFQGLDVPQITRTYYAQAILNLSCYKNGIVICPYPSQAINGTKLGLPKDADLSKHVDDKLGLHKPHWDKPTKDAVLVAWFLLRNYYGESKENR